MPKVRRVIRDANTNASVSRCEVAHAAREIKKGRKNGKVVVKSDTYKSAPELHRKK